MSQAARARVVGGITLANGRICAILLCVKRFLFPIFCAAALPLSAGAEGVPDRVLPEGEYPYWGEYKKTNFEDVRPAAWVAEDSVKDGWDWSLPPRVKPDPNSYVTLYLSLIHI